MPTLHAFIHAPHERHTVPAPRADNPRRAILLMCAAGLTFGISSVLLKFCTATVNPFECAFFRTGVGFFILLIMTAMGLRPRTFGNRISLLALRGILGAVGALSYIWAISRLELGLANALNQTSPIFVCIFAAIFLRERFHWWIYAIVVFAFFGIALIVNPDFGGINPSALIALGSGIFSALAYTCVRVLQKTDSSETIVMWLLGVSTLAAAGSALFVPWTLPDATTFAFLMGAGLTAFIAQLLMTSAYRYAPATIVAPFIYLSTFSSTIIAFIIWSELPTFWALVGCAITILCTILIGVLPHQQTSTNSDKDQTTHTSTTPREGNVSSND